MNHMDLRQPRCVDAVNRHQHFTRAAEELHLAQSALSHQIRRLERELGTPLFERTSRRVITTEAGRVVAARARRVFAELDGAREEVDELRGVLRGRIRIGALLPAGDVDVPGLLAHFSRAHPGVEVDLYEGIADDMFRAAHSHVHPSGAPDRKGDAMMRRRSLRTGLLAAAVASLALTAAASALEVGQKAPDFTLTGPGNKPVKLSELTAKGPVVIYTFIQAFTNT